MRFPYHPCWPWIHLAEKNPSANFCPSQLHPPYLYFHPLQIYHPIPQNLANISYTKPFSVKGDEHMLLNSLCVWPCLLNSFGCFISVCKNITVHARLSSSSIVSLFETLPHSHFLSLSHGLHLDGTVPKGPLPPQSTNQHFSLIHPLKTSLNL